ncbi:MAG: hypothetical protein A2W99_15415 [Bacteroidetes bacterium GWF2_33_16]|nr:MAG: hypothetical protein A2X00_09625 [Bacteroidetes bacterium GWE2_32_14]OFY07709.1 MAG: hypothetical protein A2W99_15415 [Bacteroidetes bacterium GWF2_33_16]
MLRYIFSILLFFVFSFQLMAQKTDEKKKDGWEITGIKIGMDVGRFSNFLFKPEQTSYAGSLDVGFNNKYFIIAEAGYSEINLDRDNYNYISDGTFYKIGLDYNMLKKYPTDFLGAGFRFAYSTLEHSANNIRFESEHWGSYYTEKESETNQTMWLEASFGLKGEIFKNVYFGWSAIIKVRFYGGTDDKFQPYDIPGFGKAANSISIGANYFIYYQIPFNRK